MSERLKAKLIERTMKCERCHGTGLLTYDELRREEKATAPEQTSVFQCHDCHGSGRSDWDAPAPADPEDRK